MKTFDLTFTAGETKVVPGGIFFVIISATDPIDVNYLTNATNNNENAVGVETGYFYENIDGGFTSARITSATVQTIKVAVSRGKGGYAAGASSLTGGVVDTVTDIANNVEIWKGGYAQTELGGQGIGYTELNPTLATHRTSISLNNPNLSGVNLYITKLIFRMRDVVAGVSYAPLYLEMGVGAHGANTGFQVDKRFTPYSLNATINSLSSVAAFGVQQLFSVDDTVNFEFKFNTPLRVLENRYAAFGTNLVNQGSHCTFEWFERAV